MDFEEWFNKYGNLQCDKDACEDAFEAGQQSKQAEIDALKAKIDGVLELMRQPMRGTTSDLLSDIEDILG